MSCNCPQGYTLNPATGKCDRAVTVPATSTGIFYTAHKPNHSTPGQAGTNFYADISSRPYPLSYQLNPQGIIDANNVVVPVSNFISNALWGTGNFDGRLNVAAVWTGQQDQYQNDTPVGSWIGFSVCVNIPVGGTYCIGMAADNNFRFGVDGVKIAEIFYGVGAGQTFMFNYWHVFPLTLTAGQHIFTFEGYNNILFAAFAAEIYQATVAQLSAFTTAAQLSAVTLFTTQDKQNGATFNIGNNIGFTCPSGFVYNQCDGTCSGTDSISPQCCFRLTNCVTQQVIITNTDVSANIGQVLSIQGQSGCWQVSSSEICTGAVPVTVVNTYSNCNACLPCWKLTDCTNPTNVLYTQNDMSSYVGQVIQIFGYPNVCWTVSTSSNCTNAAAVQVTKTFPDCATCEQRCFLLLNCDGSGETIITDSNLGSFVGRVIKIKGCKDECWVVSISDTCVGAEPVVVTESFSSCDSCNPPIIPPVPELLHQRKVKPGYNTSGCSPEYTEKVNCNFADQIYDQVKKRRYGISSCCERDWMKWVIKKELLDLRAIWDPELCVTCPPISCCTPCPVPEPPVPPIPESCPAPANVVVSIEIIFPCEDAAGPAIAQIVFNQPSTNGFPRPKLT